MDRMTEDFDSLLADWQSRCLGGPTGWKFFAVLFAAMLIYAVVSADGLLS